MLESRLLGGSFTASTCLLSGMKLFGHTRKNGKAHVPPNGRGKSPWGAGPWASILLRLPWPVNRIGRSGLRIWNLWKSDLQRIKPSRSRQLWGCLLERTDIHVTCSMRACVGPHPEMGWGGLGGGSTESFVRKSRNLLQTQSQVRTGGCYCKDHNFPFHCHRGLSSPFPSLWFADLVLLRLWSLLLWCGGAGTGVGNGETWVFFPTGRLQAPGMFSLNHFQKGI